MARLVKANHREFFGQTMPFSFHAACIFYPDFGSAVSPDKFFYTFFELIVKAKLRSN
jgi:hypothetical protein